MKDRIADMNMLHPVAFQRFAELETALRTEYELKKTRTLFAPFETWRSPERQNLLVRTKASKATAWKSPHQYGLAVDFVPFNNNRWSWDDGHDWNYLKQRAEAFGLEVPIKWDRAHVEHPLFRLIRWTIRDYATKHESADIPF